VFSVVALSFSEAFRCFPAFSAPKIGAPIFVPSTVFVVSIYLFIYLVF